MPTMASASSTSSRFGDATPFNIQVNFDIPLFEGQINVDFLDQWLNVLEVYFFVQIFSLQGKDHLCAPQCCPPCQKMMGNLLGA